MLSSNPQQGLISEDEYQKMKAVLLAKLLHNISKIDKFYSNFHLSYIRVVSHKLLVRRPLITKGEYIDGAIDKKTVQSFVNSLSTYASLTKTNIGLGLIIGEEIQRDAQGSANNASYLKRRKINNLLLLAKLSIPSIQE